jgi:hypothetical protein
VNSKFSVRTPLLTPKPNFNPQSKKTRTSGIPILPTRYPTSSRSNNAVLHPKKEKRKADKIMKVVVRNPRPKNPNTRPSRCSTNAGMKKTQKGKN